MRKRRGRPSGEYSKIHDMNAFLRMKRFLRTLLADAGHSLTTSVKKSPNDDDALVIHGYKSTGRDWYVWDAVPEEVPRLLTSAGIEFTAKRHGCFGDRIVYVLIRVDQEACPQPRKKKITIEEYRL